MHGVTTSIERVPPLLSIHRLSMDSGHSWGEEIRLECLVTRKKRKILNGMPSKKRLECPNQPIFYDFVLA
jgi:hypothetical protein